jgi:predicted dehydrogenase
MPAKESPKTSIFPITRRRFIYSTALAAGALAVPGPTTGRAANYKSPNEKLNIAVIGAGGKGSSDTDHCNTENIVALCDTDENILRSRGQVYPKARHFRDYRKMLEEYGGEIDAVTVSTPDNHHFIASMRAMKMGKHVYCQKPLTHDIWEARMLRDAAAKYKVATQMGNQGSSSDGLRTGVEVVQSGALGAVREVHVWSNRPIWPQGMGRVRRVEPVPAELDWDLWIGPAPMRPYVGHYQAGEVPEQYVGNRVYHNDRWRAYVDFGTGALGDMACHTCNLPFRALKLGYPTSVEASSTGFNGETWPSSSRIRYEFPERDGLPPVSFFWYDGGAKPSAETAKEVLKFINKDGANKGLPGSGCLIVGDKGHLYSPDDYGETFKLLPEADYDGYKAPAPTIPRSPHLAQGGGVDRAQHQEWIAACKGGPAGYSNFSIAAYLTEILLLGCVALRVGRKIEWDGPNLRVTNAWEAAYYLRRQYREGWSA